MDHGWFDAKGRHDDESEVVVCRHVHTIAWRPRKLFCYTRITDFFAVGVDRFAHDWRREVIPFFFGAADRHVEKQILGIRDRFKTGVSEKITDHDARGFVLDRGKASGVGFRIRVADSAIVSLTVDGFIRPGGGVTNSKTGGVFDDQPGEEQARGFHDPDQYKQ